MCATWKAPLASTQQSGLSFAVAACAFTMTVADDGIASTAGCCAAAADALGAADAEAEVVADGCGGVGAEAGRAHDDEAANAASATRATEVTEAFARKRAPAPAPTRFMVVRFSSVFAAG